MTNYKKLFFLLNNKLKSHFFFLIFLLIIASILEVVGLSLFIPLIQIILNNDIIINEFFLFNIFNHFGLNFQNNSISIILIFLLIFFTIRLVFLILIYFLNVNFSFQIFSYIGNKILKIYLEKNYEFFINNNSSKLIRNLVIETSNLISYFITPLVNLTTEIILISFLCIFIIYVQPEIVIFAIFIGLLFTYSIIKATKNIITDASNLRHESEAIRLKYVQESIKGIKEIIIFNNFKYIIENYSIHLKNVASTSKTINFLSILPRLFYEYLLAIIIILFIFYNINFLDDFKNNLGEFVFVILASIRLMPSINKIVLAIQNLKFSTASLNAINSIFENQNQDKNIVNSKSTKITFNDKISLNNITFSYNKNSKNVLQNANLSIKKNQIVGLYGKSGSGKTTIVDLILGLLKPRFGEIKTDNTSISDNIFSWQKKISYIPQSIFLFEDTILKNITFKSNLTLEEKEYLETVISLTDLKDFIKDLKDGINTVVGENGISLSGGQRQKIGIARALYNKAELIVFDESTNSLDKDSENEIFQTIQKIKNTITIIIISHDLNLLMICNKKYQINNKQIIETDD